MWPLILFILAIAILYVLGTMNGRTKHWKEDREILEEFKNKYK